MMRLRWFSAVGLVGLLSLSMPGGLRSDEEKEAEKIECRIIYVPTPQVVVEKMLDMAKVTKKDIVYDLGCGDGRVVCTAALKYGAHGVGVDVDPARIKDCEETIKKFSEKSKESGKTSDISALVEIRKGDALKVKDLEKASVIMLYMLPEFMGKLEPLAKKKLKVGSRIVAHDYPFPNWKPDETIEFRGPDREHTLYLWTVKQGGTDK